MRHNWSDILILGIGISLFYTGASGAYQNVTGSNGSLETYAAWQILSLVGGMLIGVSVNKIVIRFKNPSKNKNHD